MQKNLVSSRVQVGHLQSNSSQPIGELATSGWASLWYYSSAPVQNNIPFGRGPHWPLCGARTQHPYRYSLQ